MFPQSTHLPWNYIVKALPYYFSRPGSIIDYIITNMNNEIEGIGAHLAKVIKRISVIYLGIPE